MSNRFERLFQLPPNLHSDDSPVILLAGALLRDTQSQKVLVQLKFKNISSHKIKAVKVHIGMYDAVGEKISGTKEYQYLDLSVSSGGIFGANKAIILQNTESRSFAIESLRVVLDDNVIQDITMPLVALPDSELLEEVLKHPELFKQFRLEINEQAVCAPQEIGDTWCCSCGEWNGTEVCCNCSVNKEYLFSIYDPSVLIEKTKERLRRERIVWENRKESEEPIMKDANVADQTTIPTNDRYTKKKIAIWIITILLVVLAAGIAAFVFFNSSPEMTSLDKKYAKLTNKAAKELLQAEVSDYTWTTVETGDLVYLYTAKNSKEDQFQVHYLAKFDAADEPEDEWLELTISLSGKTDSVIDASASYWNVNTYESSFDENNHFRGFKCSWGAGGDWYNVNLSDDEFEAAKQERTDFYSGEQNDVAEESIYVKPKTTIPTEKKNSNDLSEEERILVGSWGAEYLVVNGNITAADELDDYGWSLSSLSNAKFNSDYSGNLYLNDSNYSLEWSYNTKDDDIILYSLKIGSISTTLSYVTDPSMATLYNRLIIEIDSNTKIIMTKSS